VTGVAVLLTGGLTDLLRGWTPAPAEGHSPTAGLGAGIVADERLPTASQPLVLGYVAERFLMTVSELEDLTDHLATFARAEGYTLGRVFVERIDRSPAAFQALLGALEKQDAQAVVIPTMHHLAVLGDSTVVRTQMEYLTGARVLIAGRP